MRRVTMFLLFVFVLPAMADSECPIGYSGAPYIQLEYIESTGTQYIDTGVVPTLTTGAYVRASFTKLKNQDNIIFGASNASGFAGGKAFAYDPFPSFSYFAFGNFATDSNYKVNVPTVANTIYEYELNYMNSGKAKTDTTETTIPTATEMTIRSIFLFGCSYAGRLGGDSTSGARVYRFKISDGTSVVQDLIPAQRLSDSVIGMYDTVSGQFFENAGTGTFIAGPVVLGSYFYAVDGECSPCPPNTYKDFVGNSECTPCPDAMVSPSGSKSATDCGRALWVGNKVLFMSSAPRTTTTLNVMDSDGNIFYGNLYSEQ